MLKTLKKDTDTIWTFAFMLQMGRSEQCVRNGILFYFTISLGKYFSIPQSFTMWLQGTFEQSCG